MKKEKMREMVLFFCSVIFASVANISCTFGEDIGVEKINYRGWNDCYKLSNDSVEVIIVPSIGRAISFRRVDGSNVFNTFEDSLGKNREPVDNYITYGGLYTWLAPQYAWRLTEEQRNGGADGMAGVPMDGLPHEVKNIGPRTLTIGMTDNENYKIEIEKKYTLDPKSPKLLYSIRCKNVGNTTVRWATWNLSAIKKTGKVLFSAPNGLADLRFSCNGRNLPENLNRFIDFHNSVAIVDLEATSEQTGKYYVKPAGGYIMHCTKDYWFVRSFQISNASSEILFTDNYSQIELWVDTITGLYELEILSPEFILKPNDEYVWSEELWIVRTNEEKKLLGLYSQQIGVINGYFEKINQQK